MVANITRTAAGYAVKTFGKAARGAAKTAIKSANGAMESAKAIEATVKSGAKAYAGTTGEMYGLWSMPYTHMDYPLFSSFARDRKTLSAIVREAQQQVSPKLVNAVHSFTDCVQTGLQRVKTRPNVKFISIGQSPAVVAEALSVRGVDTAVLPISKLAGLKKEELEILAKSEKFGEYLKKLKAYGMDFAKMDKRTDYIFVDYTSSGQSLKNFKRLLELRGLTSENTKFISLQDVVAKGLETGQYDRSFIERFMKHKIHECRLKKNFSPIIKLPATEVEKLPMPEQLPQKPLLEKLKLLLFNRNSANPV